MDDHITKPIDPGVLARILIKWVKPRAQAAHAADHAPGCPAPADADAGTIFDWEKGRFYVGGDDQMLVKQLKNFVRRYARIPQTLAELSAAGQWHEANRTAHSLKGVAATLGMDALSACAAALEQSYAANTADGQSLEKLRELLQRAGAEIKQNLEEKGFEG